MVYSGVVFWDYGVFLGATRGEPMVMILSLPGDNGEMQRPPGLLLLKLAALSGQYTEDSQKQQAAGNNKEIGFVPYPKQVIAQEKGNCTKQHNCSGEYSTYPCHNVKQFHKGKF